MKNKITLQDRKKYVIKEHKDIKILLKIKELEKVKLNNMEKKVLSLIKTQLKKDWRAPLINYLNKLARKYKK